MGLQPIPPPRPSFTRLDALKREYVIGHIADIAEFEKRVGDLLASGTADEYIPLPKPDAPPRNPGLRSTR